MMIKSMTGFGSATARTKGVSVSVELSSVNRKQLDIALRLPSALSSFEVQAQKIIQQKISRGRISGTVAVDSGADGAVEIDRARAEAAVQKLRQTAKALKLQDDLSASMLLSIPGLLKNGAAAQDVDAGFQCLEKALNAALKKLDAMRIAEGRALEADLLARLGVLETIRARIEKRAPQVVSKVRKKIFQTLETLKLDVSANDERVIKEVALFAERSDIAEELTRLASHIEQFKKLMSSREPSGRALDFLSQELLREINTVASKANDLNVTKMAVQFKTELERIREQVQNVE
jgi:uncharacterized protein (TIGR00255 family)